MTCFSVERIGFTTLQSFLFIEQEPLNFKTSSLTLTFDHGTLNMNRFTCTNAKLVTFKELPVNNEHMNFCVEIISSTWTLYSQSFLDQSLYVDFQLSGKVRKRLNFNLKRQS